MHTTSGFRLLIMGLLLAAAALACNFTRYTAETPTPAAVDVTPLPSTLPALETPPATPSVSGGAPVTERPAGALPIVVYTKDERLWVWQKDGPRQIDTQGSVFQPLLSPDGRLVAFLRPPDTFHTELWVIGLDGSAERKLVSVAALDAVGAGVRDASAVAINPFAFRWVGSSHTLAFNTQQVFNGPGLNLLDDLHLVDADTGEIKNLFLSGWGGMFAFSPDGGRVALSKPDQILLTKLDGSDYRKLMDYPPVTTYSEYRYYAEPRWAASGDALRFALPPADPLAQPAAPTTLWDVSLEKGPQQVGRIQAVPFFEQTVVYSPDLDRIAYLRPTGNNLREIVIATYDGQGELALARGGANLRLFGWSPDGKRLAYSLGDMQEAWIGGVDGAPQPLTGVQFGVHDLRWLDDQRLLAIQQKGQTYTLLLVNLKGETLELDSFTQPPMFWDFAP